MFLEWFSFDLYIVQSGWAECPQWTFLPNYRRYQFLHISSNIIFTTVNGGVSWIFLAPLQRRAIQRYDVSFHNIATNILGFRIKLFDIVTWNNKLVKRIEFLWFFPPILNLLRFVFGPDFLFLSFCLQASFKITNKAGNTDAYSHEGEVPPVRSNSPKQWVVFTLY